MHMCAHTPTYTAVADSVAPPMRICEKSDPYTITDSHGKCVKKEKYASKSGRPSHAHPTVSDVLRDIDDYRSRNQFAKREQVVTHKNVGRAVLRIFVSEVSSVPRRLCASPVFVRKQFR